MFAKIKPTFLIKNCRFLIANNMAGRVSINDVKWILPKLDVSSHKGDLGRIGVVGGCKEYTGAPYYAAMSALRVGCDLVHVFCTEEAAPVIKSYSPELIVHPLLGNPGVIGEVCNWLQRMHAVVIGPGLGRDQLVFDSITVVPWITHPCNSRRKFTSEETFIWDRYALSEGKMKEMSIREIINVAKRLDIPIVIDADGLFYVNTNLEQIRGYKKLFLTPNVVEFQRLFQAVTGNYLNIGDVKAADVRELSRLLGNVTVICKGPEDIITQGDDVWLCDEEGSPRRCGGQGDILSGTLATFAYWSHMTDIEQYKSTYAGSYAACWLTRKCNRMSFAKHGRSTTTTDMLTEIENAMKEMDAN